ncbi:MAG: hypothetical protein ACYC6R_18270, partial [Anaerolineales bacterium]
YYAEANQNDADVLSLPNGGWTNNENMIRLVDNIRASNAPKMAMLEAEQHIDCALARLDSMEPCAEREALENLARYIVDRKV